MNKAVFTTSDIQRFKGMSDTLESTGKLEKAIEQGYEVFVITTRTVFNPEIDDWWRNQVSGIYTGYIGYGATDKGMIETYKQFYRDQNINPDEVITKFPEITWVDYAVSLEFHGFKRGKDF